MAKNFKIKDFLKRIKNTVEIKDGVSYKRVTVSGNHKGVSLRDKVDGSKIGTKKQFTIIGGDFILSKIDARNGAFGIIPKSLDGAIITGNFWTYKVDTQLVDIEWFFYFTHSFNFIQICIESSTGSTHRKYLDEKVFLNHDIVLPSKAEQIEMVERYKEQSTVSNNLTKEIHIQKDTLSQLKQSILQEAIQGKLTTDWRKQNPNTEPAIDLLKRIKAEKAQLIKDKKIKKEKPLPPITEDKIPFEIPESWVWCRLGEIFSTTSGGTPTKGNHRYWKGQITWYKSGELNDSYLDIESHEKITQTGLKESSATLFPKGTLLIAMYGATAGKLAILGREATTNQAVCGFFENGNILTAYLFDFLLSNRSKMIKESWGMSQPNISQTYLRNFAFALPPIEEQKAIVEKVEILMQKCNALEQEITQSEQNAQMLMQAVLKEAFERKQEVYAE